MRKKGMLLIIILMAVGFAAVATNLFINGSSEIAANQDDFHVYYSDAYQNGVQDKSVIVSDTVIEFETTFEKLGQKYVLDYEVTNGSKNYDAELVMECTGGNDYLTVTNEFDDETILPSLIERTGKLVVEQTKSYGGDDLVVDIKCTINANAVERTSLGIQDRSEITVEVVDKDKKDLNADAYEIIGEDENELLESLVDTGYVSDASEVDALIEVKSDDFEEFSTATFDVSSIAEEGDKVVILHYDEEKKEWEYVAEETVDENGEVTAEFSSYSPVAFVVVKDDGSLEVKLVTIKYDANNGVLSETGKTILYHNEIGELPTPTRTGYDFSGWYTSSSGGSAITTESIINEDITIYAQWKPKQYTVNFIGNGGTANKASINVIYDATYGTLATASRTGYTFAGWWTAASGGTQVTASTKVTITAVQNLYAHWTVNSYAVAVKSGGNGSVSPTSLSVTYGGTKTFTVTPNSGYYLSGVSCTSGYTVSGFSTGMSYTGKQTVTVKNNSYTSTGTCTATFAIACAYKAGQVWNYAYTGGIQSFTTPCSGTYKLEVWGAQGGNGVTWGGTATAGGYGGYSYGNKVLTKNQNIFIGVGGQGTSGKSLWNRVDEDEDPIPAPSKYYYSAGGYNGGASNAANTDNMHMGTSGGGGATHMALGTNRGVLSAYASYKSEILIVAGGGGGGDRDGAGYAGGGSIGGGPSGAVSHGVMTSGSDDGGGGTQSRGGYPGYQDDTDGDDNGVEAWGSAGGFGYGGTGSYSSGAGGGWYGGGGGGGADESTRGGGGSGYVGGVTGGSTTAGQRSGHGYARITLVTIN